jgi:glycosyltransferase involved in cell wall biosynthesis
MSRETVLFLIPTYNENEGIKKCVESWTPVIKSIPGSQMLVINDGSTDNTAVILNKLKKKYKFLKVLDKDNEGHGKTIRLGYEMAVKSKHIWVFQTDSDDHFQPSDFYNLWDVRNTSPFILGHRVKRDDTFFRKVLSKVIRYWIIITFQLNLFDANIPFRLIKTSFLKQILPKVKKGIFAPNIHLSVLAGKDNHNLHHIPIEHRNLNKKNDIKILKGAFVGFFELISFSLTLA